MLNLSKEERVKVNGSIIEFGLGWDSAQEVGMGSFLGGLMGKRSVSVGKNIDLDASARLYSSGRFVDELSFRNISRPPAGTQHSGDNRTGAGKGEDEIITIDTNRLDPGVDTIVLVINSYTGEKLGAVANAFCNIRADRAEVATMALNTKGSEYTALIMGRFYKKDGQWRFQNISEYANAQVASQLEATIARYL